MARVSSAILDSGDAFPQLTVDTVAHGRIAVPGAFGGAWGVFLAYRGWW